MAKIKAWIEAMRLRTLPVSIAGVVSAAGCASYYGAFKTLPFLICLFFAIGAQIVSNFANEYFDFVNGLDRKGREGFRRGVTEGDISPKAMRYAMTGLMVIVCALGCSLIYWGGWELIIVGIAVAIFAFAYSAGPYPLSHHGLGEVAVVIFFGFVPVIFTTYVQSLSWDSLALTFPIGAAIGLMGANVLIVNNYRDEEDDRMVGKRTLAVRYGMRAMERLYFVNGFLALIAIEIAILPRVDVYWQLGALIYINLHYLTWQTMRQSTGKELNTVLARTAKIMLVTALWLMLALTLN